MPIQKITSGILQDGAVAAADIADGTITAAKIVSIANTQITGNIVSSQITSVANTQLTGTITGSQISSNTLSNTVFQTGAVENYMSAAGLGFGMRNRIINGDMRIDQRNEAAAVTAAGVYTLDRWMAHENTDGAFTVQQVTTAPAGFSYSTKATVTVIDSSIGSTQNSLLCQYIEGYNVADLNYGTANAQTVTLSFWVNSSVTGTFTGTLQNSAADRSYPFSYTINAANTWEKETITIAGDTSGTWLTTSGIGLRVWFALAVGSGQSTTAGAWAAGTYYGATGQANWMATLSNTFYITGVQLEKGSTATSFDYRSYGQELLLCQRYYEKSYAQGTAPGTATEANCSWLGTGFQSLNSTSAFQSGITPYYVRKRTTGCTILTWDSSGNANTWTRYYVGVSPYTNYATTISQISDRGFSVQVAGSQATTNVMGHWTCASEL